MNLCEDCQFLITTFNGGQNEVRIKRIENSKIFFRLSCHCTVQGLPLGLLIKMKLKLKLKIIQIKEGNIIFYMKVVGISIFPRHNCGDRSGFNILLWYILYIKNHILCKAGAIVSADSAEGTEYQINLDCTLSSQIAPKEFS